MGCLKCCCRSDTKAPSDDDQDEFYGPLEQRECRDVIFLIIFVAFICGIGGVTYIAVKQGNPYRLVYGVDSYGNVCNQKNDEIENVALSGQDNSDKPKVFFFDPTYFTSLLPDNPFPSFSEDDTEIICVEKCPDKETEVIDFYNNEGVSLCLYNVTPYEDDIKKCPATPVQKHKSIFNRCIPEQILNSAKAMASSFTSVLSNSHMGNNFPQKVVSDMKNTWKEIGYLSAISVGVALLVVVLMRFLAAIIVWTLVIAVVMFSLAASAYCWYSWYGLDQAFKDLPTSEQTDEAKQTVHTWLIYAAIVTAVSIILCLILLVLRKRIALVVQLYKEAGNAIGRMPCMLLLPFSTLIFIIAFVGCLCLVATFIETSGLPEVKKNGHVKYVQESFWEYLRWYNIFAMLWISSFVVACQDMVIAGAVATWYFTKDKKKLGCPIAKSIKRLIRYHLGSIAFGSFIIALVKFARLILGYIQKKLQGKAGKVVDFILKCLQFCLWCFEKFLKYLNRNAYIEIAIYGYNFCKSAQKAFMIIVSNALRVAAINSIGDLVLFLGKISTVAVVMVIGREFFKGRDDINYMWVPISVACAFAFAVAHCFLLIYEITIDTIFLCFCEDCERNDGQDRPYFMSKNLMVYLDKANKAENKAQTKNTKKNRETTKV
ncbi:choline transporter-like protein 1 isoform X2 [Mercenaria mercenaria]|uniref:choline transporter-like protein 1 isoform X2 n=1 Tax=Mercenaria mercenaria TaxID=6596 RepID=UPI00234E7849|nr:choline transporter-like protein 1 isoform X2 [Mercenaria mercenaria]